MLEKSVRPQNKKLSYFAFTCEFLTVSKSIVGASQTNGYSSRFPVFIPNSPLHIRSDTQSRQAHLFLTLRKEVLQYLMASLILSIYLAPRLSAENGPITTW